MKTHIRYKVIYSPPGFSDIFFNSITSIDEYFKEESARLKEKLDN